MTALTRTPLIDALTAVLEARDEVLEAYLFGSEADGTSTALSDVDVAVYVDPAATPDTPYGYLPDLATALARATGPRRIDLVRLNDAPPLLYQRVISRGSRILSRDLRATTTREGRALSRYCDYLPQLRRIDAAVSARLAAGTFGR